MKMMYQLDVAEKQATIFTSKSNLQQKCVRYETVYEEECTSGSSQQQCTTVNEQVAIPSLSGTSVLEKSLSQKYYRCYNFPHDHRYFLVPVDSSSPPHNNNQNIRFAQLWRRKNLNIDLMILSLNQKVLMILSLNQYSSFSSSTVEQT